jgi:hypothetical protein
MWFLSIPAILIGVVLGSLYFLWNALGGKEFSKYNGKFKKLLLEVSCDGNILKIYESIKYLGGSAYERKPVLYFNNKLVSNSYDQMPFNPHEANSLTKKSFVEEVQISQNKTLKPKDDVVGRDLLVNNPDGWNVFVIPENFDLKEFEAITKCYENNREKVDKILKESVFKSLQTNQDYYFAVDKIARIIYAKPFSDKLFYPPDSSLKSQGVVMIIQPDGNARVSQVESTSRTLLFSGRMLIRGEKVSLQFDTDDGYQKIIPKAQALDVIKSFVSEDGEKITNFYEIVAR